MKLDLACGQRKQKGFMGVDKISGPDVDFVWDLEKFPWEPFKDNSVEEIYCAHYMEHTTNLIKFMDEIWRICQDGAKVTIVSPYYTSIRAWQDPTHTRVISENTFLYFDQEWRIKNQVDHYLGKSNFKISNILLAFEQPWDKKSEEARQFAKNHYWNAVADIYVELKAIKV